MRRLDILARSVGSLLIAGIALLCLAPPALSQGVWGPFRDRADRDEALRRLPPEQERQLRVWALENSDAARRLQGGAQDPQSAILEQFQDLSPEEVDELGGEAEIEVP